MTKILYIFQNIGLYDENLKKKFSYCVALRHQSVCQQGLMTRFSGFLYIRLR